MAIQSPVRFKNGVSTASRLLPIGRMPLPELSSWGYAFDDFTLRGVADTAQTGTGITNTGGYQINYLARSAGTLQVSTANGLYANSLSINGGAGTNTVVVTTQGSTTAAHLGFSLNDKTVTIYHTKFRQTALTTTSVFAGLRAVPYTTSPALDSKTAGIGMWVATADTSPVLRVFLANDDTGTIPPYVFTGPTVATATWYEVQMMYDGPARTFTAYYRSYLVTDTTFPTWTKLGTRTITAGNFAADVPVGNHMGIKNAGTTNTALFDFYQIAQSRPR